MGVLYAELVALRVGHHNPRTVVTSADIDAGGPQLFQPGDLSILLNWSEIEVQPILARLRFRHLDEQQIGHHTVLPTAMRRLDHPLGILVPTDHPTERRCPEPGCPFRFVGIDGYCTYRSSMTVTVSTAIREVDRFGACPAAA